MTINDHTYNIHTQQINCQDKLRNDKQKKHDKKWIQLNNTQQTKRLTAQIKKQQAIRT